MAADEIHVGDVGTTITVVFYDGDTVVSIADAETLEIWLLSPSGTTDVLDATLTTDGTDGSCYAQSTASTWFEDGEWALQGVYATAGDATVFHSDVHRFMVYPNID